MITVIVQKRSISAIAERSPSHVHLIVPIVEKNFQDHIFLARNQNQHKMNLGKYDDRSDCSRSLACVHMIVTIAEADRSNRTLSYSSDRDRYDRYDRWDGQQ